MTSNSYPPPPPDGESGSAREGSEPPTFEPYSNTYQPVQPATPNYPPAPTTPYQPYGTTPYFSQQPADQDQPSTTQYPAQSYGQGYYPAAGYPAAAEEPPAAPVKARRGRLTLFIALLAALIGGAVGGGIVAVADHNNNDSVNTGLRITNATGAPAAALDGTVGAAAAKIRPSVVTIDVTGTQESGTGSGIIIRDDGYIVTNDHVVSIGTDIQVVLSDGRTTSAKIVGRDTSDDLAVIKIDGLDKLTAATFAKSSSLTVGQAVVAVGAPLGLSDTVTSGIISNLARPVRAGNNDQAVFEAVQTDAAINPGNSGGPLVDLNGSVVGINAAIASDNSGSGGLQIPGQQTQQSGNIGIGFAIPADEASRIASELIANGKATHAVLGVSVGGSTSSSVQVAPGVALKAVTAGGVAAAAGLKVGDVVTALDDQQVTTADALIAAVRNHAPGQKVKVSYTRAGAATTVSVTLGSSDS